MLMQASGKLAAAGGKVKVPPKQPWSTRAVDTWYSARAVTPDHAEVCRLRLVATLEELGDGTSLPVSTSTPSPPLLAGTGTGDGLVPPLPAASQNDPLDRPDMSPSHRLELHSMRADWDAWRTQAEDSWRRSLREREAAMRQRLEVEAAQSLSQRAEDLRRAQEEVGRLEVRLRSALDAATRQQTQLTHQEEQVAVKLAQKTAELQLLQKRVREEANTKVEAEQRRSQALQIQLDGLQDSLNRAEKRAKDAERDFDAVRLQIRAAPESQLRDELSRLRVQLSESKAETERERRLRGEAEVEKEHFRAQVHRLALALKRERERSSVAARQELEQLRLEFLAREERYVLDGDREQLRSIRQELAALRDGAISIKTPVVREFVPAPPTPPATTKVSMSSRGNEEEANEIDIINLKRRRSELISSGLYEPTDPVLAVLNRAIAEAENNNDGDAD